MEGAALRLPHDLAVPVEPDGGQVPALAGLVLDPGGDGIEILHPQQEATAPGAGEQPRQQRRAQVAQVEGAGGTRSETTVGPSALAHAGSHTTRGISRSVLRWYPA